MFIITKYPERYSEEFKKVHEVMSHLVLYHDADRIAREQGQHSFRELDGTAVGPCLVIGMGGSRHLLAGKTVRVPTFAVNRAISEFPASTYWCAHDFDSVADCAAAASVSTPLITYSCNFRKDGWAGRVGSRPVYFIEMFPDPRRHLRRPLYWNQSTVGWTLDLAVRMGFGPIYLVGIDTTVGAYQNPHFTEEELRQQHMGVRCRISDMWKPGEIGAWNPGGVEIVDLAGEDGYLPVRKGSVDEVL